MEDQEKNKSETEKSFEMMLNESENRMNQKINYIFRYKKVQITLKILLLTGLSCILFSRGGEYEDMYLWFNGIFLLVIALSELFDLEEFKHQTKQK